MGPTPEPTAPGFTPIRIVEIELADPLNRVEEMRSRSGQTYGGLLVFVRIHGEPVGLIALEMETGSLSPAELAARIWPEVRSRVSRHLASDGEEAPAELLPAGIVASGPDVPRCQSERAQFLGSAPPLTVLVPSRERPERLSRCLDSILAAEYPRHLVKLIVVDNAPASDATLKVVQSYSEHSDVVYLREDALGSASARNRGLRQVDTEFVLMTDDDTVVDRHWLTEVARTFAAFPEAAVVSGLLVPMELDTPAQLWFEQYGGFSRGFDRRVFDLGDRWPVDEPLYPWTAGLFGTGNNFAFRTAAVRAIRGFDPALGNGTPALGGVDTEILLRTILTGHTIVYEPRAIVHHAHRVDYQALRRQIYAYGAGLSAVWLKTLIASPGLSLDFARKAVPGLRFALSPRSAKNRNKRTDYPSELTKLEVRGMLYGPFGYAKSRRRYGPHPVPPMRLPRWRAQGRA
jgi:GT2 family glycosyltransferase